VDAKHPRHGEFRQVAPTLAGSVRPELSSQLPDVEVTDTDDLLRRAGLSVEEVIDLREAGVVA
jgi:hypothetical protein